MAPSAIAQLGTVGNSFGVCCVPFSTIYPTLKTARGRRAENYRKYRPIVYVLCTKTTKTPFLSARYHVVLVYFAYASFLCTVLFTLVVQAMVRCKADVYFLLVMVKIARTPMVEIEVWS